MMKDGLPVALLEQWSGWLAAPSELASVEQAAPTSFDRPVMIFDRFLLPERAAALRRAVRGIGAWERLLGVGTYDSAVKYVAPADWEDVASPLRFCQHDRAKNIVKQLQTGEFLSAEALRHLRLFFAFAFFTPTLAAWIAYLTGLGPLRPLSFEIARYRRADYISFHSDSTANRAFNLVLYLDSEWQQEHGGELLLRSTAKIEPAFIEPVYNRAVLLRIRPDTLHSVLPWRVDRVGREAISLSFAL